MTQQIAEYFNRFYYSVLKDKLNDPLLHSEWIYFMSMFKPQVMEKERIELYLTILGNEKKKKEDQKMSPISHTLANQNSKQKTDITSKTAIVEDIQLPSEIKMEKRHSEKWKPNLSFDQNMPDFFQKMRRMSDMNEGAKYLNTTHHEQSVKVKSSKSKQQQQTYALPSCNTFYPFYTLISATPDNKQTQEKKDRERHNKLKQISERVLKAMGSNSKLRA